MNYWIKTALLVLLSYTSSLSQDSSMITIVESYELVQEPVKKIIEFDFTEDGRVCGLNAQFETVDEQFSYLKYEILKSNEMAMAIKEDDRLINYFNRNPTKTFQYQFESVKEAKLLYSKAKEAFAERFRFYHYYEEVTAEELSDAQAKALTVAYEKAKTIAKREGYKEVKVLSIDKMNRGYASMYFVSRSNKVQIKSLDHKQVHKHSINVVFVMK